MTDPRMENAFRWTPRLIGISPLLIFSYTLFTQGGPALGIWMVLILMLLAILLLFFYTLVSILSRPKNDCKNPLMRLTCDRVASLIDKSTPNQESIKSASKSSPWSYLRYVIGWVMRGVTASASPYHKDEQGSTDNDKKKSDTIGTDSQTEDHSDNSQRDSWWEIQKRFFITAESFQSIIRLFASYLFQLRVQVGIVLICLLLFQTQQVKDVVLAMALDDTKQAFIGPSPFSISALLGTIFSLLLWHTTRQITRLMPEIELRRKNPKYRIDDSPNKEGIFSYTFELVLFWLSWVSLALFTVPVAGEAYGAFTGGGNWNLYIPLVLGGLLIFLWRVLDRPKSTWTGSFPIWFYSLFLVSLLVPIFIQGLKANQLPHFIGSLGLLFWALSIYLVIASTIFQFSLVSNIPLFSLILVGVYLFNINRFNDNHAIRLLPQITPSSPLEPNRSLPPLKQAFLDWYKVRRKANLPGEQDDIYHVYVVSAQGGGIYAAYHSAKALAVLSEEVPGFSDHIFAISGVSGGSVGATVFVNALRTEKPNTSGKFETGQLSKRIDNYFEANNDRLAMIVSTMLFGDTMQRFYPIPVPAWDRSLGLELGFENLFPYRSQDSKSPDPIKLQNSFYSDQDYSEQGLRLNNDSNRHGLAPYLALNTTEVENGRRYILSPFRISSVYSDADFHEPWLRRPEQMKPLDIRYSTAAGMSARFPIVSPYGFFTESRARRFIDGGLYDNSGAITAKEIIDELTSLLDEHSSLDLGIKDKKGHSEKIKIKIIPIAIVDQKAVNLDSSYADAENLAQRKQFRLFGWSAIDAILSTREARLQKAVDIFKIPPIPIPPNTNTQNSQEHGQAQNKPTDNDQTQRMPADNDQTQRMPAENGLGRKDDIHKILLQKDFMLGGNPKHVFSVPLGWKLSCEARAFINDQIQPYPRESKNPTSDSTPTTNNPTPTTNKDFAFSLLGCEQNIPEVKREPLRTHHDNANRNLSLSHPFWELIDSLRCELNPKSKECTLPPKKAI